MNRILKNLSIILTGFVFSCFVQEREDTEGWKKFELKGKVKSLEKKEYQAVLVDGKIQKGPRKLAWYYDSDYKIQFSDKGLVLEEDHVTSTDQPYYHTWYFYDKKGKLTEDHYLEDGELTKMYYYYDSKGRIQKEVSFDKDSLIEFETTFQYRNDSVYSEKSWKSGEAQGKKVVEVTDPHGWVVGFYVYGKNGALTFWRIKKLDRYGSILESRSMEEEQISSYTNSYKRDGKGRIIEQSSTFGTEKEIIRFSYDDRGNCIRKEKYTIADKKIGETIYQFDRQNNLIKRQTTEGAEILESLEWIYEYDDHKNWINCTYLESNKPVRITERKIEYY